MAQDVTTTQIGGRIKKLNLQSKVGILFHYVRASYNTMVKDM
jgi:hypothetical protein